MTKAQAIEKINAAAKAHGFETREDTGMWGVTKIISEELTFAYKIQTNTDWEARGAEQHLQATAFVRKMGDYLTAEELLKTADEIKRGGELVAEINNMNLTWVETF